MALIDQLIAYYPFRDDLNDHSGNNYHISQDQADEYLAQGNFRPLPTIVGGGMFGDGTLQMTATSAALFPENVLPALRGDGSTPDGFTVSFWARIDPSVATGTGQGTVLFSSLGEAVDSSKFYRNFLIHLPWGNNNGYFDCGAYRYDNGNIIDGESPNWVDKRFEGAITIPGNEWHHWVFTKDDLNGGIRAVYRDGVLQSAWTGAPNEVGYDNVYMRHSYKNSFYLGSHDFRGWPGQLNELMFHSRALTPQEAVDLYNGGSGQALPIDSDLPTVTVEGDRVIFVEQGSSFTVPAATAVDSLGASIAVSVNNPVDTSAINTYDLVFSATDSNGKTATATIAVVVRAASLDNGLIAKYDMIEGGGLSDDFPGIVIDTVKYSGHGDRSQADNVVTLSTYSSIDSGNFLWPKAQMKTKNSVSGDFTFEIDFDITNMPRPNFNEGQNYAQIGAWMGSDHLFVRIRKLNGLNNMEIMSGHVIDNQWAGNASPSAYTSIEQGTFHISRVGSTIYGKIKNTSGAVIYSFDRAWSTENAKLSFEVQTGNFTNTNQASQSSEAKFSNLVVTANMVISGATTVFGDLYSTAIESGALLVEQDGLTYLDLENNNGYLSSAGTYSEFDSFTVSFSMFRSANQDSSIISTNGDQAKAISALLNDNIPGATGKMNFWVTGDANAAGEAYLDLPAGTLNKWVDITWVRDFPAQEYRLYKDGVLEETISMTNMVSTSFNDFQIGAWKNNSGVQGRFFNGQLNNFAIWDRALSGTEVQGFIAASDRIAATEQSTYSIAGLLAANKHMVFLEGKLLSANQYTIVDDSLEITDTAAIGFAVGGKIQIVKVK